MNWTLVQCADCGQPYAARSNETGFYLPTESGACPCGNDTFVELESSAPNGDSVAESD
jgi:hypothetical protein